MLIRGMWKALPIPAPRPRLHAIKPQLSHRFNNTGTVKILIAPVLLVRLKRVFTTALVSID